MPLTTIREALQNAKSKLRDVSSSADLDAQLLLLHVIDKERAYLFAHPEAELTPEQQSRYEALIDRRADGEPVDYLRGWAHFYDRTFDVSPAVLIPRPETEILLEMALERAKLTAPRTVVDVGTGSGALAVTFKALYPSADVHATDISPDALKMAGHNASKQGVMVTFHEGDLLQPIIDAGVKVDMVLANLPYIATDDMHTLEVSRHEPHLALDGGADGIDPFRRLVAQIPQACNQGAWVYLEIGADQGQAVLDLVRGISTTAHESATLHQDYARHDRIVAAQV